MLLASEDSCAVENSPPPSLRGSGDGSIKVRLMAVSNLITRKKNWSG
jgi:hypothetical protein